MNTRRLFRLLIVSTPLILGGLPMVEYGLAKADEGQNAARRLSESGIILPFEKISGIAKKIKPGRILESELEKKNSRYIYEIEILDAKGQVWEINLDAHNGKFIKLESED